MSSLANNRAYGLYAKLENRLVKYESMQRLPDDRPIDIGGAQVLIFGMGRVGAGVYDTLLERYGENLLGIDYDPKVVDQQVKEGRNVIVGDATDYDFWERLQPDSIKLILLDMPNIKEALTASAMIKQTRYQGLISATVKHNDFIQPLKEAGVAYVYNIYAEAGSGFANHVCKNICNNT